MITETNMGTAACPAGAVAIQDTTPDFTDEYTTAIAGYHAATCTFSIGATSGTAQSPGSFTVIVKAATTTTASNGTIVLDGGEVETFDPLDPVETSVLSAPNAGSFVRDATGATFVAQNGTIAKYAPNSVGNATIAASTSLGGDQINGLGVDAAGNLYVLDVTAFDVVEYSSDLSTQIAVLSGSATGLGANMGSGNFPASQNALAVDANGRIFVLSDDAILEFAPLVPGANSSAPTSTIPVSYGYPDGNQQIALDASDDVFFNDGDDHIVEFPHGSTQSTYGVSYNRPEYDRFGTFTVLGNRIYATEVSGTTNAESLDYFTIGSNAPEVPVLTNGNASALQGIPPPAAASARRR